MWNELNVIFEDCARSEQNNLTSQFLLLCLYKMKSIYTLDLKFLHFCSIKNVQKFLSSQKIALNILLKHFICESKIKKNISILLIRIEFFFFFFLSWLIINFCYPWLNWLNDSIYFDCSFFPPPFYYQPIHTL